MKYGWLTILLLCLLCNAFNAVGQDFEMEAELTASQDFRSPKMRWVDFYNDGRYDLLIHSDSVDVNAEKAIFDVFVNEGEGTFRKESFSNDTLNIYKVQVHDVNKDFLPDILFSGYSENLPAFTSAYINQGDFTFELLENPLALIAGYQFVFTDLDGDLIEELLIAGEDDLGVEVTKLITWKDGVPEAKDLGYELGLNFDNLIEAIDFTNDGRKDLVIVQQLTDIDSLIFLENKGELEFEAFARFSSGRYANEIGYGDYDANGFPDILNRETSTEGDSIFLYQFGEEGVERRRIAELGETFSARRPAFGDVDNDGSTDIVLIAEVAEEVKLHWIQQVEDEELFSSEGEPGIVDVTFTDWNADGLMDLVKMFRRDSELTVAIYRNTSEEENEFPSTVAHVAVQTEDGVLLTWNGVSDDKTDPKSVSYDVLVVSPDLEKVSEADFEADRINRTAFRWGDQLYSTKLPLSIPAGDYKWRVQTIDNQYHFWRPDGTGEGDLFFDFTVCEGPLITEEIETCVGGFVELGEAGIERSWYSAKLGLLGNTDELDYIASETDTVYASIKTAAECSEGQLRYIIKVEDTGQIPRIPVENLTVCRNEEFTITLGNEWSEVVWFSIEEEELGRGNTFTFESEENAIFRVVANNENGCRYRAFFRVTISIPELELNGDEFTIQAGGSVQLEVSGVETYAWSPTIGLDDPTSANPVASPLQTITYTVTGTDSIGCTTTAEVEVTVQDVGNVPNLFSPNGDSRNDRFTIFLETEPVEFRFRIFTRSGNLVYDTSSSSEAVNQGWDGTLNGEKLPPGTYYWRVQGTLRDGTQLKLNGQSAGKVQLIR